MLLLLPPSETKRDGGDDSRALDLSRLSFPALGQARERVLAALMELSNDTAVATAALALGPTQAHELERNRELRDSAVLAAIDRYTGVLYDGLDAQNLSVKARRFAATHLAIHSALFGLVLASDPIPAYRLSHNSRLPTLSLRTTWKGPITATLTDRRDFVLDLRSDSYAALGPAPAKSTTIRVVTESVAGTRKALSHFNKKAKGEFTRAVLEAGIDHDDAASLVAWGQRNGQRLEHATEGQLDLVV